MEVSSPSQQRTLDSVATASDISVSHPILLQPAVPIPFGPLARYVVTGTGSIVQAGLVGSAVPA